MSTTPSSAAARDPRWLAAGLAAALLLAGACVAFLVRLELPWVRFPADVLTWSESGYVGNILKLETGAPLYGPPGDGNSVFYTPASPVVTWALLRAAGADLSVPALRSMQALYVCGAVALAAAAARRTRSLLGLARPAHAALWEMLGVLLLLLAATSPTVNRLVLTLHADALALFASLATWLALVACVERPSPARRAAVAVAPALGFAVKQYLLAWIPVTALVLLLLPRREGEPPALFAAARYLVAAIAAWLALLGAGFALWGADFRFWVFDVLGGRPVTFAGEWSIALLRGADHLLRAWPELAVGGLAIGWLALRARDGRWPALAAGWLLLVAAETFSSGAGWSVLYHFGPAVLIGASALVAALPSWTSERLRLWREHVPGWPARPLATLLLLAVTLSVCLAWRVVPTRDPVAPRWYPGRVPPPALFEQARRIESEIAGLPPGEVLLDLGNWVFLPTRTLARYRADALADQPPGGHYENFAPLLDRIRARAYRKILLRDFHSPHFLYDWASWPRPSGVRAALEQNYREVALLPAVVTRPGVLAGPVSVLVPREGS